MKFEHMYVTDPPKICTYVENIYLFSGQLGMEGGRKSLVSTSFVKYVGGFVCLSREKKQKSCYAGNVR